jgi:hypothetical protein
MSTLCPQASKPLRPTPTPCLSLANSHCHPSSTRLVQPSSPSLPSPPVHTDLPLPCALRPLQPCRHSVRKPPSPSDPLPRPASLSPTLTATPPLQDYSHLLPPSPPHLSTLTYPFPAPSALSSHVDTLSASLQAPQTHSHALPLSRQLSLPPLLYKTTAIFSLPLPTSAG